MNPVNDIPREKTKGMLMAKNDIYVKMSHHTYQSNARCFSLNVERIVCFGNQKEDSCVLWVRTNKEDAI